MSQTFNRSLVTVVVALGLFACADPNALNKNSGNGATATFPALCQLAMGQSPVVCIDFPTDNSNNSASCVTVEYPSYEPFGANSEQYEGVSSTPNATTSCASFNPNATKVGSCTLGDRFVRYYSGYWSVSTAQTNCASRNGQWGT